MCGITAISRVNGRSSISDPAWFLRLAALAIEERGTDATGWAWTDANDESWYWKDPTRARDVVHTAPLGPASITTAIGHTRAATQGDKKNNVNNHPVMDGGIMLVHNGVIHNDYEIYDWIDKDYVPKAQVDSQSLATLLANPEEFYSHDVATLLTIPEGPAAIAWIDTAERHTLHLARLSDRPMTLGRTRLGDLVMSSTPGTMAKLASWSNTRIRDIEEVDEGTYMQVVAGEIVHKETFKVSPYMHHRYSYTSPYSKGKGGNWNKNKSKTTTSTGSVYRDKTVTVPRGDVKELEKAVTAPAHKPEIIDAVVVDDPIFEPQSEAYNDEHLFDMLIGLEDNSFFEDDFARDLALVRCQSEATTPLYDWMGEEAY